MHRMIGKDYKLKRMQTFYFLIKVPRYKSTKEKSAYMVFFPYKHYQIVYLNFSEFQLVLTD